MIVRREVRGRERGSLLDKTRGLVAENTGGDWLDGLLLLCGSGLDWLVLGRGGGLDWLCVLNLVLLGGGGSLSSGGGLHWCGGLGGLGWELSGLGLVDRVVHNGSSGGWCRHGDLRMGYLETVVILCAYQLGAQEVLRRRGVVKCKHWQRWVSRDVCARDVPELVLLLD